MKNAAVETDKMDHKEQQIQKLKEETGFDEIVIGCFLSNYMIPHVCPIATGGWCRDYVKCKCVEEGIMRNVKEQQAHNEAVSKEEEKPLKTFLLIALLVFLILCIISLLAEGISLIVFGPTEVSCMKLIIGIIVYAVISLLAAGGLIYYIIRMEEM